MASGNVDTRRTVPSVANRCAVGWHNRRVAASGLSSLTFRPARPEDDAAVLGLLQASMGWVPDAEHQAFFHWKHRENPHGGSPAWVATDGDDIVGYRTFLRWPFRCGDSTAAAVRAVDTATHPDYQGRGIFSQLTRSALTALEDEGVDFVFNTPNGRSLPGYLKLGWEEVGRLPVSFRPRTLTSLLKVARARTPASKWSAPSTAGLPAADALRDPGIEAFVRSLPGGHDAPGAGRDVDGSGATTLLSPEHLRWRYGYRPLDYRVVQLTDDDLTDGLAIFRLRRRGPALEAAVCELLLPASGAAEGRDNRRKHLLKKVLRSSGCDHAVLLSPDGTAPGAFPLPGQGPTLVWRRLGSRFDRPPTPWHLTLGDIELF